ncbi:hypothetical protein [Deinococcus sonorensis]|uniref:DUF3887 domain-containing protein n=2 Tax=Deinococcus sonorensis TaxID=309891 RepID=A0AAU7UBF9_9DEIO
MRSAVRLLALLMLAAPLASAQVQIPATPPPKAAPAPASAPVAGEMALARGRQLVQWFYAQQLEPVWAAFLPSARQDFANDLAAFQSYRAAGIQNYGRETSLISERVLEDSGVQYYLRTARFERGPDVAWTLVFGLNAQGQVVQFGILNAGPVSDGPST